MRIGLGYDVHAFAADRPLILAGVTVPHHQGLTGHSDADVLAHTVMDALLGALGLGTIGDHFPDTDPQYKDADSMKLLSHVMGLIKEKGYHVINLDSVIVAQAPKLAPHIPAMQAALSQILETEHISVKATTSERLGFEGREEGISAQAVVLLNRN